MIILILFFVKSVKVSIVLNLLFQSLVPISEIICLNSSMIMGSTGFKTGLFCLLKVLVVVLKPYAPPIVTLAVLLLKSDDDVNFPNPSLPDA